MTSRPLPIALVLLWLVGNALRLPILAVPPVIPALRSEFGLSGTEIGILTGLPVILFAAAAMPGSRLVARLGAVAAAVAGLLLAAFGSALRGAAPDMATLFAATIVMGVGVAVTQPAERFSAVLSLDPSNTSAFARMVFELCWTRPFHKFVESLWKDQRFYRTIFLIRGVAPSARLTSWRGPTQPRWRRSSATGPAASRGSQCTMCP